MKKFYASFLTLFFTLLCFDSNSQIYNSDCTASDSVYNTYINDASLMTIRKFERQSNTYLDSVIIPIAHVDTALNAILAVYNLSNLPERDSIFDIYKIRTHHHPNLDLVDLRADSTHQWMQNWNNQIFPTGHPAVDSIFAQYPISHGPYFTSPNNLEDEAWAWSDTLINTIALAKVFDTIQDINHSSYYGGLNYGISILDSIYPTHVELIFSHGWMDCFVGCVYRRYWKFNVFYDCSVEFVEAYGSSPTASTQNIKDEKIVLSPNPFFAEINIQNLQQKVSYKLINNLGKVIKTGETKNKIHNLDKLPKGLYTLQLINAEGYVLTKKVIKQ